MLTKLRSRIIDRYIIEEVVSPFAGAVIFISFVFLMFQILRLAEEFIVHGVSLVILTKILGCLAVGFLPFTLPIAFLVAVLVAFGRLSSDAESIAMKACGMSLPRQALPVFGLATVVLIFSLLLNTSWAPLTQKKFRQLWVKVGNTQKVTSFIQEGTFTPGFFDLLIYADKVDQATSTLKNVFIYDEREAKSPRTIIAESGQIISIKTGSEFGASALLKLFKGNIHRNSIEEEQYQKIDFGEYNLYLSIPEGADAGDINKPRMLTSTEIREEMKSIDPKSERYLLLDTEAWSRWAVAIAPIFFVFLGVGFGTVQTRSVKSGSALITFLVVFLYWFSQIGATKLAHSGILPAFFAVQIPNIITGAMGFIAFRKASW